MARTSSPTVRRAYESFSRANSPMAERRAIQIINSGYYDAGLGPEFTVPFAQPGTMQVTLEAGGATQSTTLMVQADPLIAE